MADVVVVAKDVVVVGGWLFIGVDVEWGNWTQIEITTAVCDVVIVGGVVVDICVVVVAAAVVLVSCFLLVLLLLSTMTMVLLLLLWLMMKGVLLKECCFSSIIIGGRELISQIDVVDWDGLLYMGWNGVE